MQMKLEPDETRAPSATLGNAYPVTLHDKTTETWKHKKFKDVRSSDGLDVARGGSMDVFDKALFDKMVAGKSEGYTCSGCNAWFDPLWQTVSVPFNASLVNELTSTKFKKPSRNALFSYPPPPPTHSSPTGQAILDRNPERSSIIGNSLTQL